MAKKRQGVIQNTKGKSLVTPAGGSLWTKLDEPNYKFNPKGTYEAGIVLDPSDDAVAKFIAQMEKLRDAGLAEAKENLPPAKANKVASREVYHQEEDAEGNETGNIIIKTKDYAVDFDGDPQKVPVFNSKGIEQENFKTLIGNGSIIKIQLWASAYHMPSGNFVGVSYKLKKVQIIELKEYSSDAGFGDESGTGFEDAVEEAVATTEDF